SVDQARQRSIYSASSLVPPIAHRGLGGFSLARSRGERPELRVRLLPDWGQYQPPAPVPAAHSRSMVSKYRLRTLGCIATVVGSVPPAGSETMVFRPSTVRSLALVHIRAQ